MNSQLLLAVSQTHQAELRQAAGEARAARASSRPRTRFMVSRRFRVTPRIRRTAPAVSAQARAV